LPKYGGIFGNIHGQEEQRRVESFLDQHDREYVANIEITTGDPCSTITPMGWLAPLGPDWFRGMLMPPEHIVQMVPRMERARRRYQLHINYEQWLREIDERNDAWDRRLADLARSSTKGLGFAEMIENPPAALLDYLGPKAFPPRVFIEAMAAGDPWSLGQTDVVPKKAVLLLRELEPYVTKRRRVRDTTNLTNPFADDDDADAETPATELTAGPLATRPNPLGGDDEDDEERDDFTDSKLDELDELFDPEAKGGTTEPVRTTSRGGGRRPRV
jgi:hypothetical protein